MEGITPELMQWAMNQGPLGLLVVLGVKWVWNGTSKRLTNIETSVASIDKRLLRIEVHQGVERDESAE